MNTEEIIIKIENLSKTFGNYLAIDNISLDIPKGSFLTFLGPSGCGKTTLLRLIAGFYEPDDGNIYFEEKKINELPAYKRDTPLVFQEYALFPHLNVFENIAYGLKLKKTPKKEIQDRVDSMLKMFGLIGMENRYPKELSGGQQQRVAFARALVMGKNVLLMDEPLSNLDAKMRVEVRDELRALQKRFGFTAIFVTHDQDEALSISDQIAVFNKGQICQVGTPMDIYFKPKTKFVADFVGTTNFVEGKVIELNDPFIMVKCNDTIIRVPQKDYAVKMCDEVTLVIRPECISISAEVDIQRNRSNGVKGNIVKSSFLGRTIRYWVGAGSMQWIVDDFNPKISGPLEGQITLTLDQSKVHLIKKRLK
ncbi:ABC transporter ATP-binding protein [Peribacillus huizhouensis]|uniref:ABC-type Fe3+/spermidine/putrescine transport system ATPase subunit n=1 Tax=Peribacillus huizhouensis TaxID=1501239 RepID=A0ABR6CN22_9BACI|nr:ABC transporter ATP-binding protein [Peribacillus huizhouensis]MBA9026390.1 ABC-type Fe3+/spermidine/putrescine transport system ATPase subunit [Peribacillus huizhouensis]